MEARGWIDGVDVAVEDLAGGEVGQRAPVLEALDGLLHLGLGARRGVVHGQLQRRLQLAAAQEPHPGAVIIHQLDVHGPGRAPELAYERAEEPARAVGLGQIEDAGEQRHASRLDEDRDVARLGQLRRPHHRGSLEEGVSEQVVVIMSEWVWCLCCDAESDAGGRPLCVRWDNPCEKSRGNGVPDQDMDEAGVKGGVRKFSTDAVEHFTWFRESEHGANA